MPVDDVLLDALRDALNHLYDPDRLRTSPFMHAFGLSTSPQPTARLQQILLDAIHAMQPPSGEPAASVRRRIYNILRLRYEQQFSQKEVAAQLGLSVRQYRRLQQAALQALALQLSEQFDLAQPIPAPDPTQKLLLPDELPETLQWISKLPRDEPTRIDHVMEDVLRLIAPLAQRHAKTLRVERTSPAIGAIHQMVLRQVLVNLLNAAILHCASAEIAVSIEAGYREVQITIFTQDASQHAGASSSVLLSELAIAQTMIRYFGGELTTTASDPAGIFFAELRCRSAALAPILVVDDHADTLELLQRYMADTAYSILAVSDPQQAVDLAALHQPHAILLDVMMPEMDGWDVLMQLKQDERTAHVPVLICTILDQSELALSLGASGFLRKPITRLALLTALDALEASPAPTPP